MPTSIDFGRRDKTTIMAIIRAAATTAPAIHANVDHCRDVWATGLAAAITIRPLGFSTSYLARMVGPAGTWHYGSFNWVRVKTPRTAALPCLAFPNGDGRLYRIYSETGRVESFATMWGGDGDDNRYLGRQERARPVGQGDSPGAGPPPAQVDRRPLSSFRAPARRRPRTRAMRRSACLRSGRAPSRKKPLRPHSWAARPKPRAARQRGAPWRALTSRPLREPTAPPHPRSRGSSQV